MVAVEHPGLDVAVLERDEAGRLVGAAVGATSHEWAFTDGFITRHARTGDGGSSASVMDYTEDGRLASVTTDGATTAYSYDASGQLTAAAGPKGTNTWAYDAGGRLTLEKVDGTTWKRTYNAAGRLLRAHQRPGERHLHLRPLRAAHRGGAFRRAAPGAGMGAPVDPGVRHRPPP